MTQATYDLYWIAVDRAAQGHGVGHVLLARVEAEVQARGGRLLLIETSDIPAYAAARRLYESAGYSREAVVHDFYAPGDSLLIFSKHLGAASFFPGAVGVYRQEMDRELLPVPLPG